MIRNAGQLAPPHRFTVADYHRMAEAGILTEDDRVELLDGEIIRMGEIGPDHADVVDQLAAHFIRQLAGQAIVRVQNPVLLSDRSEPEPDVVLARTRSGRYRAGHPTPADVLLLVEVAYSSYDIDQRIKLPLYAQAGIREVWIVDVNRQVIDVYESPAAGGIGPVSGAWAYQQHREHRGDDAIAPRAFPDCRLRVADLFWAD